MIDHILAFRDEATARADPVVGRYYDIKGGWNSAHCVPNALMWDPAEDVESEIEGPFGPTKIIHHTPYDDQFRILIALPEVDNALLDHGACEIVSDRTDPKLDHSHIIYTSLHPSAIEVLMFQPVMQGSNYPFLQPGGRGL